MAEEKGNEQAAKKKDYFSASRQIRIRFKHDEYKKLHQEAEKLKIPLAQYVRTKIENGEVKVRTVDIKFEALVYELNKIGVNLNQYLTRYTPEVDREELADHVYKIVTDLKTLLGNVKEKLIK